MTAAISPGERSDALFRAGVAVAKEFYDQDRDDLLGSLVRTLGEFNLRNCSPPLSDSDVMQVAYRCIKQAAKSGGGEREVKAAVLSRLAPHFHIFEEVWGTHWSGKRMRIDAIVTPKDDSGWKTKTPKLGIEFKNHRGFNPSFDMKDYTKWWAQCHDYAETLFDGHGYVNVFSFKGFDHYRERLRSSTDSAFVIRFWGRLGVGELQDAEDWHSRRRSLVFVMNGTNKVWSEARGVLEGSRMGMDRKFGSR